MSTKPSAAVFFSVAGLILLVLSGRTIVSGAVGIASAFGLDAFVIGATVVALGTSVPELATTVLAKLRGHQEVAMGTILGSNIFNGLFIMGVAAVLSPMRLLLPTVAAGLAVGAALTICAYPPASGVHPAQPRHRASPPVCRIRRDAAPAAARCRSRCAPRITRILRT